MSSIVRKIKRGSVKRSIDETGNLIIYRKSNGGNSKKTKSRRRYPKGKYVILQVIPRQLHNLKF